MSTPPSPDSMRLELAITELRGSMDAGMARIEGRLELLVQRAEHADQRAAMQDADLRRLDGRVDELERLTVTRAELEVRDARMREELAEQARRKLMLWGLVLTVVFGSISAGIAVIAIVAK